MILHKSSSQPCDAMAASIQCFNATELYARFAVHGIDANTGKPFWHIVELSGKDEPFRKLFEQIGIEIAANNLLSVS